MPFQISALDQAKFQHLFTLSDDELAQRQAKRVTADKKPGFPCRVSLQDAEVGEEVILLNYEHLSTATPYRACHAIYVRKAAQATALQPNEVPELLRYRILSLRGFDQTGMLVSADLAPGQELEQAIEKLFHDPQVQFIHLHYAKPGCYAARVDRS